MAQGRGFSATIFFFFVLLLCSQMAHATTFVVGDKGGWDFNVVNWPKGKNFKAGDILVFNYNPDAHDVTIVDEAGYNSCKVADGSKKYQSGHDQITLVQGPNFFVCSFPGHCQGDMKIAVNAA